MYVTPYEARHDPVTARPARGLRELEDDPSAWWEGPGAANDRLIAPPPPPHLPAWRRVLFVAAALAAVLAPVVAVVEWMRP
jgi:hypothetical protein